MEGEFPSNSRREKEERVSQSRQEPKKVEKVIEGEVIRRKKPLGKRLTETFVGADARSVWSFVALDVLIPAAKDMFADAVSQGVERLVFGDARSTSRRTGRRPGSGYTPYNRYSGGPRDEPRRPEISRRARAAHDFDEIILNTRAEAEEVIDRLFEIISKYEVATVADLYDLVGIAGSYTDDKWGWTDIRGTGASRVRNGYLLDLPRPEPID